jgi:hypothetical protein
VDGTSRDDLGPAGRSTFKIVRFFGKGRRAGTREMTRGLRRRFEGREASSGYWETTADRDDPDDREAETWRIGIGCPRPWKGSC